MKNVLVHAGSGGGRSGENPVDVIRQFTGTGKRSGA